jgi:hypothetical protein
VVRPSLQSVRVTIPAFGLASLARAASLIRGAATFTRPAHFNRFHLVVPPSDGDLWKSGFECRLWRALVPSEGGKRGQGESKRPETSLWNQVYTQNGSHDLMSCCVLYRQ